jgi:hypothetical protein
MARKTWPSEQNRHHAPIQGRLHSHPLLLRPSVFRASDKQVTVPHPTSTPRESSSLDLVQLDICGPMLHPSLGVASYFVTFIDDAMGKVWAYPTRTKDRVFTIFKDWLAMVKNQTDRKLKCLRSDNGGENKSDEFVQFFRESGIRREFTAPYNPKQNGVAERINRTIHERIFLCCTIPDLRTASGLRRYSRPCTLSTCRRLGLLDRKFCKSFGQDENWITESCDIRMRSV